MPNYDYFPSQDPSLNLLLPTEMLQRLEGAKKIEHYSPGVLGHIDIAFAQLDDDEQDPRRNLPSRVQDNYNLYKLTLQRALNKQEVSPEFNEIFTDELGSLLIFDKLIALHELFKLFIELDEEPDLSLPFAESAISSLSKRSNCEDYSRGIASVLQEESTYNMESERC